MNKYVKVAIVVLAVVVVFVLSFLVRGKQSVRDIDFNEYQNVVKKGGFVYYGSSDVKKTLKEFCDLYELEFNILNPEDLSESENKEIELKNDTIYNFENGKSTFTYSGDVSLEKLAEAFGKEELIRTYKIISLDEYLKIIKSDGNHFMFIGSDSCGYCDKFKVSIIKALIKYDFNVYYLNIKNLSEDELSTLYATDKYFEENEWGTPLNFLYKDGKRVGELNGYVETDVLVNYLKENKVI